MTMWPRPYFSTIRLPARGPRVSMALRRNLGFDKSCMPCVRGASNGSVSATTCGWAPGKGAGQQIVADRSLKPARAAARRR